MAEIPQDHTKNTVRGMLRDPYRFISRRCSQLGTDIFQARLAGERVVVLSGPSAAEFFYTQDAFIRAGAAPKRLIRTLFGAGGVQSLDGDAHRVRKELFTSLLTRTHARTLAERFERNLRDTVGEWRGRDRVVFYDEMVTMLTRTVCDWAEVPLPGSDLLLRARQLEALYDGAGALGPRHWRSRQARMRAHRWAERVIADVRTEHSRPGEDSALSRVAWHKDEDGALLDRTTAATELLNVLRPTVAVAVYLAFVAHALQEYPQWRQLVTSGEVTSGQFVEEVRRYYPFFPGVFAKASSDVDWRDYRIPAGTRVLLDLYGTNHDPRTWAEAQKFDPERFRDHQPGAYEFVPQGGGVTEINHRCPGEPITTELMKVVLDVLVHHVDYQLPRQDMRIDFARLPALPRSRVLLNDIAPRGEPDEPQQSPDAHTRRQPRERP